MSHVEEVFVTKYYRQLQDVIVLTQRSSSVSASGESMQCIHLCVFMSLYRNLKGEEREEKGVTIALLKDEY